MIAYWNTTKKPPTLGNLLIFRKELEILAQSQNIDSITIYFDALDEKVLPYIGEVYQSSIDFHLLPGSPKTAAVWPPDLPIHHQPFASWTPLINLSCQTQKSLALLWPQEILDAAKTLLHPTTSWIACHLKNRPGGPEESNASLSEWRQFFQTHPEESFLLLGDDVPEDYCCDLPQVKIAQHLGMSLSVQLASVSLSKGFIGMATGFSACAVMGDSPYVIFKNPLHHAEQMQQELGDLDHFPFARKRQKVWRRLDTTDALHASLRVIHGL